MKTVTDYLFVEFEWLKKGHLESYLTRIRYKVTQSSSFYRIHIEERGSPYGWEEKKVRHNRIHVGAHTSEEELFNEVRSFISEKHGVEKEAVAFRWENRNIKFKG